MRRASVGDGEARLVVGRRLDLVDERDGEVGARDLRVALGVREQQVVARAGGAEALAGVETTEGSRQRDPADTINGANGSCQRIVPSSADGSAPIFLGTHHENERASKDKPGEAEADGDVQGVRHDTLGPLPSLHYIESAWRQRPSD